jgi:hypothetical protein
MDFRRPILLKASEVEQFKAPVYMLVSNNDVLFPGPAAVKRAKKIFKNLKDVHTQKNSKHIPGKENYPEIQQKIKSWIG